ncbi:GlcG/HbpS family heme-binding protein [Thiohalorhabdus sp.]|uniref:GlcG/HbpS family heme-binding protein n=1 Tax=Thiohalorhabdus sp. TaxID=3094134 RepID=UPI002FC3C58A
MAMRFGKSVAAFIAGFASLGITASAGAQEDQAVMKVERMSMELSGDIAEAAVKACRDQGYQVTAAVVDRNGNAQVVMRDVYAPEVSYRIAKDKAYTAVEFSVNTHEVLQNREGIGNTLNHVDGLLFSAGGLIVETGGGSIIGGVGVSGAPEGEIDRKCAQAGLDAVSERLQFAGM